MKRKIIIIRIFKIALFPIIIIPVLLSLLYLIPDVNCKDIRTRGYTLSNNHDLDAVILGDSSAYAGFIPATFYKESGLTSYNCGQSMQKISSTYAYLTEIYEYQSPSLIIIELSNLTNKVGKESTIKKYNFFEKLYYNHDYFKNNELIEKVKLSKGYIFSKKVKSRDYDNPYEYLYVNKQTSLTDEKKSILNKIIELTQEHNTKLLFTSFPCANLTNNKLCKEIKDYASLNEIDYIDFNYPDSLEDYKYPFDFISDTQDIGVHANVYGAKKLTTYIANYIKKYNLTPYDNNEEYIEDVNNFYQKYSAYL